MTTDIRPGSIEEVFEFEGRWLEKSVIQEIKALRAGRDRARAAVRAAIDNAGHNMTDALRKQLQDALGEKDPQ